MTKQELHKLDIKYIRGDEEDIVSPDIDENEYPAIFLGLLKTADIGSKWPPSIVGNFSSMSDKHVTLVFTKTLLRKRNWHINMIDNMGFITNQTFTKKSLQSLIEKKFEGFEGSAELMFHDKVSLVALEELWTDSKQVYRDLVEILPDMMKTKLRYVLQVPDREYNAFSHLSDDELTSIGIDTATEPNFCYWIGSYGKTKEYTLRNLDKILANCHVSKTDFDTLKKTLKKQDYETLGHIIPYFYSQTRRPPPVYYPEDYDT